MKFRKTAAFCLLFLLLVNAGAFSVCAAAPAAEQASEVQTPYTKLRYQSLEAFEKDLKGQTVYHKLIVDGEPVRLESPAYQLSSDVKVNGKKIQLKEILCNYRLINYIYDKGVSLGYYPKYAADEALIQSYKDAKKDAVKTKTVDGHKVYVLKTTQGSADYYLYTWTEKNCLFELALPQKMGIDYGLSLCKVTAGEASAKETQKKIIQKTKKGTTESEQPETAADVCILYPKYTSVELTREADAVVLGMVTRIEPGYSSDGNFFSKVDIAVTEVLKGQTERKEISIPMFGGTKNGSQYTYEGAPSYEVGEEVALYLNKMEGAIQSPNHADDTVWYIPVSYQAVVPLRRGGQPQNISSIIEQIKKDITAAENPVPEKKTITIGEPVENIMLEEE